MHTALFQSGLARRPEKDADQFVASRPLLRGERQYYNGFGQAQSLADPGQVRLDLALFELVQLIGHYRKGASGF